MEFDIDYDAFVQLSYDRKLAYARGRLVIAIGDGRLLPVFNELVSAFTQDAYTRGYRKAKAEYEQKEEEENARRWAGNPNPGHELHCPCDQCMYLRQDMPELWGDEPDDDPNT